MASDAQALLLTVSADTSKALKQLEALNKKLSDTADNAGRASKKAGTSLERFFGKADPAKALDKVFDATRFRVLDSGIARVGLFGSALETLGPAGLIAAAGIGAAALALGQAKEALSFADAIGDAAQKLGVTTDTLQAYRYAIHQVGGEYTDADEALGAFQQTLGKAQIGFSAKAVKPFTALGLDPKTLGDTDHAIGIVLDRLSRVRSEAQRQGLAAAFGLDKFAPLAREGTDRLNDLLAAAKRIGFVMDAGLIARAGEANDRFEDLQQIISVQMKSALVELGPVLLKLTEKMADLAKFAADITASFAQIPQLFLNINEQGNATIAKQIAQLKALRDGKSPVDVKTPVGPIGGVINAGLGLEAKLIASNPAARAAIDARIASLQGVLDARGKPEEKGPKGPPIVPSLPDTKGGEVRSASEQAIDKAQKAELAARVALTANIVAQGQLKELEIAADLKQENDRLAEEATQGKITQFAAEKAIGINKQAAKAKIALAQQETEEKLREQSLADQQQIGGYYDRVSAAAQGLAKTTEERGKLEARNLADRQRLERKQLDADLAKEELDPTRASDVAAKRAALADAQDAERAALAENTRVAGVEERNRIAQDALQLEIDTLGVQEGLATTSGQRRDIELRILDLQQRLERIKLQEVIDANRDAAEVQAARDRLAQLPKIESGQKAQVVRSTETSFERLRRESQDPAIIAEKFQDAGVKAFESLADGLADAIVNAKSLGDVAKNVFRQLIADILSQQIRKVGLGLLTSAFGGIPQFASGTAFAPGGLSLVGERGPELVNLPRGAAVIPNSALSGMRPVPQGSMAPVVNQTVMFDNRGAVIWEDAQVKLQQYADNAAVRAGFMAYQGARRDIPAGMAKSASSRLGR